MSARKGKMIASDIIITIDLLLQERGAVDVALLPATVDVHFCPRSSTSHFCP
jgi:hypothetical protein